MASTIKDKEEYDQVRKLRKYIIQAKNKQFNLDRIAEEINYFNRYAYYYGNARYEVLKRAKELGTEHSKLNAFFMKRRPVLQKMGFTKHDSVQHKIPSDRRLYGNQRSYNNLTNHMSNENMALLSSFGREDPALIFAASMYR